jgi:hypothetical protein
MCALSPVNLLLVKFSGLNYQTFRGKPEFSYSVFLVPDEQANDFLQQMSVDC